MSAAPLQVLGRIGYREGVDGVEVELEEEPQLEGQRVCVQRLAYVRVFS